MAMDNWSLLHCGPETLLRFLEFVKVARGNYGIISRYLKTGNSRAEKQQKQNESQDLTRELA
uniref:Uncharacterized protein n=1 Tax=Romanomermis culicivorax TaxID=13658 RepID=A0A915HK64_ROMCU